MKQFFLGVFFVSMFLNLPTQVRAYTLEDTVLGQYLATTTEEAQLATTSITFATSTLIEVPKIPAIMVKVAECESGNREFYDNGKLIRDHVYGTHVGVYQLSEEVWGARAKKLGFNIYTRQGNIDMAMWIYDHYGLSPWKASLACHG